MHDSVLAVSSAPNTLTHRLSQYRQEAYRIELSPRVQIQRKLRVSITDGCNFNCFFCHNEGQGRITSGTGRMSVSEITKIIEIAVRCGIQSVKLTGGEPLVYRYGDENIIHLVTKIVALKQSGLDFTLSMITNGYLLEKYASALKEAGLERVNVSVSTLNEDLFYSHIRQGKSGSPHRIIEGISAAAAVGLRPIKVNMPLFYSRSGGIGNVREIPDVIRVCKDLGVDELRLYTLLWHKDFPNFEEYYLYWDSEVLSRLNLVNCNWSEKVREQILDDLKLFALNWSTLVYPKARMVVNCDGLPVSFETMMRGRFGDVAPCDDCEHPQLCQEGPYGLRASADGDVKGCLLSKRSVDLLQAIRAGATDTDLTNAFQSSFALLPRES